jgi:beta-fructofuranosidase
MRPGARKKYRGRPREALIVYAPRGFGLSEVGDVEVFPEGDRLHLFYLTLPNHDVVQHVVSDDGLAWQTLPNALRTGEPGACDDDQIWTMSVTERAGTYYMVYTALARAEDGRVQRTAMATSTDLIHWTKNSANPVAEADLRWYEATVAGEAGWVSWRDPKPILVDGTYYATVCARERSGPQLRRGCVGLLASTDLISWEVRPPLFAPRAYWDLECPQVFRVGQRYYLTAAIMEDRTQRYWVADRFAGPYRVPNDGGILAPRGHYAGRVCHWRDLDLYFCWHKADYDWLGFHNPHGKLVPAPLVLELRDDGSLARRSFPGWETYRIGSALRPAPRPTTLLHEQSAADWRLATEVGRDVVATGEAVEDVVVDGALDLAAPLGGLAFRLDEAGGGYFVELSPGSREVTLKKWLPGHSADDGRPWFRYAELQRGALPRALAPGQAVGFRLIVNGSYVEVSFDGEVVLATATAERTTGLVGIWADSGQIRALDLQWSRLKRPEHR